MRSVLDLDSIIHGRTGSRLLHRWADMFVGTVHFGKTMGSYSDEVIEERNNQIRVHTTRIR